MKNTFDEEIKKFNDKNNVLLINQFSSWDNNNQILNNFIYQNYFKNDRSSCILYVKNKYTNIEEKISDNDNNNNTYFLKNIIFNDKNDFNLFGAIFNNNNENEVKCSRMEIETNFKYGEDDSSCDLELNNKKKLEEKLSILSHFELNTCKKFKININNIILFYDDVFVNEIENNVIKNRILLDSPINKYCVILRNVNFDKNKQYINQNNGILENYYIEDIPYDKREILSYCKVVSFNNDLFEIYSDFNISNEISNYGKIILMIDNRIEKILKEKNKESFLNYISNAEFSYDITNENKTENLSNGLYYLSKI